MKNKKEVLESLILEGLNIGRAVDLIKDCMALSDLRGRYIIWRSDVISFIEDIKLDSRIKNLFYRKDSIMKTMERGIGIDINDYFCQKLIENIEEEVNKKLDYLGRIPDSCLDLKITLREQKIEFNDNKVCIKIGEKVITLPSFKNEHFFCRAIYKYLKKEPVDWSVVYEEITGNEPSDKTKNKRMIYDTSEALNNRIKEIVNTDDDLFTFKEKTIVRNY